MRPVSAVQNLINEALQCNWSKWVLFFLWELRDRQLHALAERTLEWHPRQIDLPYQSAKTSPWRISLPNHRTQLEASSTATANDWLLMRCNSFELALLPSWQTHFSTVHYQRQYAAPMNFSCAGNPIANLGKNVTYLSAVYPAWLQFP